MKDLLFCLFIYMLCPLNNSVAQESKVVLQDNKQRIEQTINKYFNGWMTGDTTLLGQAMHASCHLKFVRDGKVEKISRNAYLSRFQPHKKKPGVSGRITSINITRTAAAARCEIERPDRLFTDYFNLLKVGDRWYIVDKISTSIAK